MNEKEEMTNKTEENYSLNDDRRVKTLSPGALVVKRFLRNKVAVVGMIILIFMFLFSFLGGLLSPYSEDQIFYRTDYQNKEYAAVIKNTEFRYVIWEGESFPSLDQAKFVLATIKKESTFESSGKTFEILDEGNNLYGIQSGGKMVAYATYTVVSPVASDENLPVDLQYNILKAVGNEETSVEYNGDSYEIRDGSVYDGETEIAYASPYVIQAAMPDIFLEKRFKDELLTAIEASDDVFTYTTEDGETHDYEISYDPGTKKWSVLQATATRVFDSYSFPNAEHWLGTDKNGMDMLTRLMYGGRVSLYIGFIVVIIESVLGVILGGISGYFGKWVDNLIMRIVDVFYCIPSTPLIIILGAAMDAMRLDPQIRMIWLMLLLGFLGWPGIARLVRGQILSLREQEFMTATEATGVRVSRRILKHLIPNVMPQLIVTMTMGLGSVIIIEATLSFLGLGVKFPFASWGNIINDVNNTHVLTSYWFIWIPAGICLLLTVLAFNLVGDGLRDAFDPKMKR